MTMIFKELFVTYDLAVKLKEKGFDEPCLASFGEKELNGDAPDDLAICDNGSLIRNSELQHGITAALYDQVINWFADKHGIDIWIEHGHTKKTGDKKTTHDITIGGQGCLRGGFDDRKKALRIAIAKTIKII